MLDIGGLSLTPKCLSHTQKIPNAFRDILLETVPFINDSSDTSQGVPSCL